MRHSSSDWIELIELSLENFKISCFPPKVSMVKIEGSQRDNRQQNENHKFNNWSKISTWNLYTFCDYTYYYQPNKEKIRFSDNFPRGRLKIFP